MEWFSALAAVLVAAFILWLGSGSSLARQRVALQVMAELGWVDAYALRGAVDRVHASSAPAFYQLMTRLVERGFVGSAWGDKRGVRYGAFDVSRVRWYRLTEAGRAEAERLR